MKEEYEHKQRLGICMSRTGNKTKMKKFPNIDYVLSMVAKADTEIPGGEPPKEISPIESPIPKDPSEGPQECMNQAKNSKDYCKNMCARADEWGWGDYFWAVTIDPFIDKFKGAANKLHMCNCGCECQQCEDEKACAIAAGMSDIMVESRYRFCRWEHNSNWDQGPEDGDGNPTPMTCQQSCQSTLVVQA